MKELLITTFLIFALPLSSTRADFATDAVKIGFIKNRGEFDGCGCSLWLATDRKQRESRLVFVDDLGETALMNIDGKDVKLPHLRHYERQAKLKVGDKSWWEYQKNDLKVRLDFVVTKVCPPKDESCEVTHYNAQLSVTRGAQKQILKTKGTCGC
ncbi:MAG: hypothetical protein JST84_27200 [Acidobacteria bacterium]|nr:hypothetical protein [Acidobacteriota bacterium]